MHCPFPSCGGGGGHSSVLELLCCTLNWYWYTGIMAGVGCSVTELMLLSGLPFSVNEQAVCGLPSRN